MKLRAIRRRANAAQWECEDRWIRTWATALMWRDKHFDESARAAALDELAQIDRELGLFSTEGDEE